MIQKFNKKYYNIHLEYFFLVLISGYFFDKYLFSDLVNIHPKPANITVYDMYSNKLISKNIYTSFNNTYCIIHNYYNNSKYFVYQNNPNICYDEYSINLSILIIYFLYMIFGFALVIGFITIFITEELVDVESKITRAILKKTTFLLDEYNKKNIINYQHYLIDNEYYNFYIFNFKLLMIKSYITPNTI